MYLIEGAPNQSHRSKIYYIREPSDPGIFLINSTIWPLYINTSQKTVTTIGFGTHYHTPATTNVYHYSPVDQQLQQWFQPAIISHQIIADNTTYDTLILEENGCGLSKLIPLLRNLTLDDYTFISLKTIMMKLI